MEFDTLLTTLNPEQQKAVLHPLDRPAMVVAGAGSGKTKVLTTRVAYLLSEKKVRPSAILLVTFTNKASQEMMERVRHLTGQSLPFSGTFHRLCARILRIHARHLGYSPHFAIYDSDDQESLMSELVKEAGYSTREVKPRVVLSMISEAKNSLITPESYTEMARGKYQEIASSLYPRYQQRLVKSDAVDFDDLLMQVVTLLQQHPKIREYYQSEFEHILIDEYQDTNGAQLELTQLILNKRQNLFVVGDFAQAIYSWRGADYRNMLALTSMYPTMIRYDLSQNYRSTQSILDVASGLIAHNTSHPVLSLWTDQSAGQKVTLYDAESDRHEVSFVRSEVSRYLRGGNEEKIAILYRTNAQSRVFEEELLAFGIPYRLVGGLRFYARKEIKDLLSYLRLWVNQSDEVAYSRVEKLGKKKLSSYLAWTENEKAKGVTDQTTLQLLDRILASTDYLKQFDEHDEEDRSRIENIQELRSVAGSYSEVTVFLETVALVEEEAQRRQGEEDSIAVSLMSIHSAKGLEFEHVFVVGLEEGLFPHSRALLDRMQMEEERRLCYVALTRAKKTLTLSFARRRLIYGRVSGSIVSRFIAEIPEHSLDRRNTPTSLSHRSQLFSQKAVSNLKKETKFVPFDDPSIDDFLDGNLDVSSFLKG